MAKHVIHNSETETTVKNSQQPEIRQAMRQIEAGHYMRHKGMKDWLLSWGTARELPPPKCICGKNHRESFMSSGRSMKG
jgi:predicted transcriptional regulator